MIDIRLASLQLKGKARRFFQAKLMREETARGLEARQGECNRCGACCKILFRCPFLGTDEAGQYTCRIYENRAEQCRLFPFNARDLRELTETCSYTFPAGSEVPVSAPLSILGLSTRQREGDA